MTANFPADAICREQCLDPGSNPLQPKALNRLSYHLTGPSRQGRSPHRSSSLVSREDVCALALERAQLERSCFDQRDDVRARPLSRSSLQVVDREGVLAMDIFPTQPGELLDALSAGEQMEPQIVTVQTRHMLDQAPVDAHFLGR